MRKPSLLDLGYNIGITSNFDLFVSNVGLCDRDVVYSP
jgi:hypothetical protein